MQQQAETKSLRKSCQSHCCCEFTYTYFYLCILNAYFVFHVAHPEKCNKEQKASEKAVRLTAAVRVETNIGFGGRLHATRPQHQHTF